MGLQSSSATSPHTDPGTLALVFQMHDVGRAHPVTVTVQAGALQKFGGGANPLSVFELHRAKIEAIASRKFDQQGASSEVTVSEEDVEA